MLLFLDEDPESWEKLTLKVGVPLDHLSENEIALLGRVFSCFVLAKYRNRMVYTTICKRFLKQVTPWLDAEPAFFLDVVARPVQDELYLYPDDNDLYGLMFEQFLSKTNLIRNARQSASKEMQISLQDKNRTVNAPKIKDVSEEVDEHWMRIALEEARAAQTRGEVPVGAVLVSEERELARAGNSVVEDHNPTSHAEMRVIAAACKAAGTERIPDSTIYVTLEPCPMCATALASARVKRIVWAADDPKYGACGGAFRLTDAVDIHHRFIYRSGVLKEEAETLLKEFFASCRAR